MAMCVCASTILLLALASVCLCTDEVVKILIYVGLCVIMSTYRCTYKCI